MKRETRSEILYYIRERENIPEPQISVKKMLKQDGMENYARVCYMRILNSPYLNNNHVYVDFVNQDILLDKVGLIRYKEILLGYISEELFYECEKAIFLLSDFSAAKNDMLKLLRSFRKSTLLKIMIEGVAKGDEYSRNSAVLCLAELKGRSAMNILFNIVKRKMISLQIRIKYPELRTRGKNCDRECTVDETDRVHRVRKARDWVTYYEALERFEEKHGGKIELKQFTKTEIQQYVYLVVKKVVVGNKIMGAAVTASELESCIMAIGMLKPEELEQLFPIEKRYDGIKYGVKDYFFSRDEIQKHGTNKMIGDWEGGTVGFLWDYENNNLSVFLIEYANVMNSAWRSGSE